MSIGGGNDLIIYEKAFFIFDSSYVYGSVPAKC